MDIKVGLVDDHQLFLKSLTLLLETLNFNVILEALSGAELFNKLAASKVKPDLLLVDVNMPVMDGVEIVSLIQEKYPAIRVIGLSMNNTEQTIIKMFRAGCCAYLLKDVHPTILQKALQEVYQYGYYNGDTVHVSFRRLLYEANKNASATLTFKEVEFLKLACSDLTYKEIASILKVSERTVDGYRETLFQKLNVQSRVGLCLEALRKGFIEL